ncbi:TetR family transcriptional regulator [Agrobacterium vitis]|nr:TetR family transcriptional regulator [Agrobacterium vitis]
MSNRREALLDLMVDHVLSEGMQGATLRPLAAAAGTSDRMLLYYFADKDELIGVVLERVSAKIRDELEIAIPVGERRSFDLLLQQVWAVLGSQHLKPYMDIWLDLVSGAARDVQPYRKVAGAILDGYLSWVRVRLQPTPNGMLPSSPELLITAVQGMYLFEAIGRPAVAKAAMTELSQKQISNKS